MPGFIEPCDPTLREKPPRGEGWVYEIKADGYRAQLHFKEGRATLYSRTGLDWSDQFSSIAAASHGLNAKTAVIDGEAVVYGETGLPDFQQLRRELGRRRSDRLRFHAFDLLYLDGYDLRGVAFIERKQLLQRILKDAPETFIYVDYVEADGDEVFRNACKLGLEGLVAKRLDGPYRSGRQEIWIKLKCKKSDTFPIVAFVEKLGAHPRRIASLYVGRWEGNTLIYAGKVRTGYSEANARELREWLDPLIRRTSPLSIAVKKPKATWVEPLVNAEVEYGGGAGLASRAKTSCSSFPTPLSLPGRSWRNIGRASGKRRFPILGTGLSSWCVMSTAQRSITKGLYPGRFRARSGSCVSRSARAERAPGSGWMTSRDFWDWSRSAQLSSIPGTRRSRTSSAPIKWSSISIPAMEWIGTLCWRRLSDCAK
jgi:DNA ligase D-like protein (predicted ligase)